MSVYTIEDFKVAARKAYKGGDIATARKLIARSQALEQKQTQNTDINSPMGGFKEAFSYGIDAPLDNIGKTAKVLGFEKTGDALTNLTDAPQGYESASGKFIEGDDDGSYAWRYLPKAAVEQGAQFAGQQLARVGGAALGTAVAGAPGTVTGALAAPVIMSAIQHFGPAAMERAKNQGRQKPNLDDMRYVAGSTAGVAFLDSIGLRAGGLFKKAISEMGTEGLQSVIDQTGTSINTKEGLNVSPRQAVGEGIIGGASSVVVNTAISGANKAKNIVSPQIKDTEENRAAVTFANRLQKIANENNHNLNDVDVKSTNGAREVVTKAHTQMSEELRVIFNDLKPLVKVEDTDTFVNLKDKILAEAGRLEGKNLAKSQAGKQELDALERLVGHTQEGQRARNLLLEMNELTALHKKGYKGGLSKYTDLANPFNNITPYFSSQGGITGLATTGAAYMVGGPTGLAIQGGAFAGGRAIDAVTGRRSAVKKYLKKNTKGNRPSQVEPTGISLREQRIAEAQKAQEIEQEELELYRHLDDINAPPKGDPNDPNPSPQYLVESQTGLSKEGVATALNVIEKNNTRPIVKRMIDSYRKSLRNKTKVYKLSELIQLLKKEIRDNPKVLSQVVNKPVTPARSPQIQQGIDSNLKKISELKAAMEKDFSISTGDKVILNMALNDFAKDLGLNPVEMIENIITDAKDAMEQPIKADRYLKPYLSRITLQQKRK